MKKCLFIILLTILFGSCTKDDIMLFNDDSRVCFDGDKWNFSFIDSENKNETIINVPIAISGLAAEIDRKVKVVAVLDSNTTAEATSYEIFEGLVKANEYKGLIPIRLNNFSKLDTSFVNLRIKIVENDFFKLGDNKKLKYDLTWTNQLIKPANWYWLNWYFGTYSSRYYKFIIEVTGRTQFPYFPKHPDKEKWNWTPSQVQAYAAKIKDALNKYNLTHAEPLKHDDGEKAGQIVEMP